MMGSFQPEAYDTKRKGHHKTHSLPGKYNTERVAKHNIQHQMKKMENRINDISSKLAGYKDEMSGGGIISSY